MIVPSGARSLPPPPPPPPPPPRSPTLAGPEADVGADAEADATAHALALAHTASEAPRALSDFELVQTLGAGTFGRVYLARVRRGAAGGGGGGGSSSSDTDGGADGGRAVCALKVFDKAAIVRAQQVAHVLAERRVLAAVRHPFIVAFRGAWADADRLYLAMAYAAGGELLAHLRRAHRFTDAVARFYAAETALALAALHAHGILYRDLKPENLLLDARGHVQLTDFGFTTWPGDGSGNDPASAVDATAALSTPTPPATWTLCGTPDYVAPEIVLAQGHGAPADWWALGVLIYEMRVGRPPFAATTAFATYDRILRRDYAVPADAGLSPPARDIIDRLLTLDPVARLGATATATATATGDHPVCQHPWFDGVDWRGLLAQTVAAPFVPQCTGPDDSRYFAAWPETERATVAASMMRGDSEAAPGADPFHDLFAAFAAS